MTRSRIAVTGVGAVSAWGWGTERFWAGVCGESTAVGDFERFHHTDYPTHVAAEVPPPPPQLRAGFPRWRRWTHADRFAVAAAVEAIRMAALPRDLSGRQAAVFFGSSTAGMFEAEQFYARLDAGPLPRSTLVAMASQQVGAPGEAVARELRADGSFEALSCACSSAGLAIALALQRLRAGETDLAIAGGSDSLCRVTYGGFNALGAVDERPCRPFRACRAGLSLGEGAAVLVLEPLERALERGATPLGELAGAGASADAHHPTAPHPEGRGAALALRTALADAGCGPEQVDFVNAHGTGTTLNDTAEYRALRSVFGERAGRVPVTSTKASVGHLLGSAGAIEAVASLLCLRHQRVHPTHGPGDVDLACPVALVRGSGLCGVRLEVAASLNLGFGGCNCALILRRWGPE